MQGTRQVSIKTPLGPDELLFVCMHGTEELGRLFSYSLVLYSLDEAIKIEKIIGQNVTVSMELESGDFRFFNGFISHFSQVDRTEGGYAVYEAVMHPWLWFLTRTADCRIFQEQAVPDIIKQVFNDNGFSDFIDALSGTYRTWEYCVQYRESDFNFISRLMEHEGIYYYFKHEDGKHQVVLSDAYSSHDPICGKPELPYHLPGIDQTINVEHISNWNLGYEIQPGTVALGDYNFKTPQNKLRVNRIIERNHAQSDAEVFDYPGEYTEANAGEQYALERIEERHVGYEQVSADSDARCMASGGFFTLFDHPRDDQNREYLVVKVKLDISTNEYSSGGDNSALTYQCSFTAIHSKAVYRTERTSRKPFVQGPQTAVVVGPSGEEIYPDEYGRVKVQFHWDRYGEMNENSSCWIRVAQTWAGPGWGAQFIPRITQEVMVEFLEGDPNRPIITGRVYNADNMPPYSLPDKKTQSGIKSHSSPNGSASNFNEIRMEDKKDSEELYIQAEKDENILVKNCKTETVGVNETVDIGNDQAITVGNNQTETVKNDRTETVQNNEALTVFANRSRNVGASESVTVASNRSHTVGINESIIIGVSQEIAIGAMQAVVIGAAQTTEIGASQNIDVGANQSIGIGANQTQKIGSDQAETIGGNQTLAVGKKRSTEIAEDDSLTVGKNLVINAGDTITLTCGKASISMKKDGTIIISGKDIAIKGSGKVDVKASKDIIIKGKKVLQN